MAVDHLADALNTIKTHEYTGQRNCTVKATKLIGHILEVLHKNNYIAKFEKTEDKRGGYFTVELSGKINNCGVIRPRFPVQKKELVKAEQRYIPGVGVGLILISTPKGILTNTEAEEQKTGGRLLAYVY